MCSFKSIYFVIFILNLYGVYAEISDKRLCADQECNEPLSLARTLLRYSSPDPRILSFAPNTEVTVYSKEAGSETSLWGAVINGKRGYIPKHLVREFKVYKKPTILVDTELKQKPQVPKETASNGIDPDNVKPYEIVEGTTVYLNSQDGINPSSTESPVLSTSLPPVSDADEQTAPADNSKDPGTAKKDSTQESIVDKVSSSFSNWLTDDTDSEEVDAEDDEEDDDEDEEDEEEDSLEGDSVQTENKSKEQASTTQDINSLHKLPSGIKVSTYSLEVDQLVTENGNTNMDKNDKPVQGSNNLEPASASADDKPEPPEISKDSTGTQLPQTAKTSKTQKLEEAETVEPEKSEHSGEETEHSNKSEGKAESSAETVEEPKPAESKTDEQFNKEPENIHFGGAAESVTEPSVDVLEEQVPIIDDVTTPNPLGLEEQDLNKDTPTTFSQDTEENKNKEVDKKGLDLPETTGSVSADSSSDNSAGNQNIIADEEKPLVISNDFSSNPQNKETNSDETVRNNDVNDNQNILTENIAEPQQNFTSELPDGSKIENVTNMEDQDKEVLSTIDVLASSETDESVVNNIENQISIDDDVNNQKQDEEKNNSDIEENSQSDEDKINIEISPQEPAVASPEEPTEASPEESTETSPEEPAEVSPEEPTEASPEESTEASPEESTEASPEEPIEASPEEPTEVSPEQPTEIFPEEPTELSPEHSTENSLEEPNEVSEEGGGILSGLFSFFGGSSDETTNSEPNEQDPVPEVENELEESLWESRNHENPVTSEGYCDTTSDSCNTSQQKALTREYGLFDNIDLKFNSDFFLLLVTTAGSVIVFLFVYMALDRHKREAPLVARINKLERELLITLKENELLQEKGTSAVQEESVPNEVVEQLTQRLAEAQLAQQALEEKVVDLESQLESKDTLEEQIESLEKELETSTEVGMELNRIISEMLDPTNGSDRLKENVEQLQRQLLEQKDTINDISEALQEKEAENRTLRGDLERTKKVAADFQSKLDEMVEKILKIEREKDQQQNTLQNEITVYQQRYNEASSKEEILNNEIQVIRVQLVEVQRQADLKTKEYQTLKESLNKMKSLKNDSEALKSLLDTTSIKAEIQQLKAENAAYVAQLQQEQAVKVGFEKKYQAVMEEISLLKKKYEQADKEKVEVNSKLEVLNNYFKKRESELQEEIIRYRAIWDAKEGEATSTTERIKYLQEEIENYKGQNETLKQEIISQEIDLKSQISVLEKKVHENWVTARQTERKLEDARQEAAQLRNRLTLRERAINEERIQNRLQSPVEQNGELPLSPHTIDSPASPPLLYGARDHITKSPPLPGLPPFLPPPPGAPFMPPPLHGMPPFMPPPPSMFPGDHRPPPLGRMSSPPLNSRYSPDTSAFSPYDRRSPSPPYDSEYGASPPPMRGYSPYNSRDDRRDYKRPPHGRTNGRNAKVSVMSSGSDHSNDSLEKINRKQSKMV